MSRIPCTVLGATGVVGQRFVRRLSGHPLFELRHLAASPRNVGRTYGEACTWRLPDESHAGLGSHRLQPCTPEDVFAPVVFSALDTEAALTLEPAFARAGALVFTNASAFRMDSDVPLLIPEVNPGHLDLLVRQRTRRGWGGGIVANPNCTTTLLTLALTPLHQTFGVEAFVMSSLQAASGAGHPGVPSLDLLGNVIPFIPGEEGKVEAETLKLLGCLTEDGIRPAELAASALCHRVPVVDGHLASLSLRLAGRPSPEQVREALAQWRPPAEARTLPSAPASLLVLHAAEDRPQPRLDAEQHGGLSVHLGRIRNCPVLGVKLAILGHNTERGAAGASVLNAELAVRRGLV